MGTYKWHCLEHLVDSLKGVGGIEYLRAGHYESAHKITKRAYQITTEQNESAMKKNPHVLEL